MNRSRVVCICIFSFLSFLAYPQNYSVNLIPDSIKENADCVIREHQTELEIHTVNSFTQRVTEAFTVLNRDGQSSAWLIVFYDKNSSVKIKQVTVYDASGKKVRSVKSSEITDIPAFGPYSLFSEDRAKYFKPEYPDYPYTIAYSYEREAENEFSFGCWRPLNRYNLAIEHARFRLLFPPEIKINKKEILLVENSQETISDKSYIKTWSINYFKAIEEEPFDHRLTERVPSLYLMPSELEYEKYKGRVNNWNDYGQWVNGLYAGRDQVSDAEKLKLSNLTKNINDTLELIKTLYKYLQDNTRYVNITLGLGGFQPFDAKTVFETGYGDCKALSNYLHSLLKLYGIKSYSALVSSGRYIVPIFQEFPNFQQFNHVILCVPFRKDTIWLECTDQKIPFGFLGDFTDDRDVLLLTEKGGQFAHTRKYNAADNLRTCYSKFDIDSNGLAVCNINATFRGLQYNELVEFIYDKYDDQKKWLYKNTLLPSSQISSFTLNTINRPVPSAILNESIISKSYGTFSGKYMIIPLNLINVEPPVRKMIRKRQSKLVIERSSIDIDTIVYKIPSNYKIESLPKGKTLKSAFGEYEFYVSAKGNEIIYVRSFTIREGEFNPSEYKNFYDFVLSVSKADNSKLMISKL